MPTTAVFRMVKRRAAAAELPCSTCCHTFRATGITAYRAIRQEADENGCSAFSMREIDRELATHRHQCRGVSRGEKT